MNWILVREELKACREAAQLSQAALAALMEKDETTVAKSTVGRIENVLGEPEHVPDLDTIERWLQATGVKLSVFFERVELAASGAPSADKGTTTTPPAPVGEGLRPNAEAAEGRAVSANTDQRALNDLRQFIQHLSDVLADAAAGPHTEGARSFPGIGTNRTEHR